MKKTLFIFASFLIASLSYSQVQIGNSTTTTSNYPVNCFYDFSYSEQIYLQTEIDAAGNIDSISFYFDGGGSATSSSDWTIYLGHTSKASYTSNTDWITATGLTQVFSGTITIPTSGWVTIPLSTVFTYNNIDNLVVAIDENGAGYDGSGRKWRKSSTSSIRCIYDYRDNTNMDPLAPTIAQGTESFLSNIIFRGIQQSCPKPTNLVSFGTTTDSTNITWINGANDSVWQIQYGTVGFALGTGTIINLTNDTVSVNGLTPATTYDFYVKSICHLGDSSTWLGPINVTTLCPPSITPPYLQDFTSFLPSCWGEGKGYLSSSTVLTGTSSNWAADGFANNGAVGSARMEIWSTGKNEWLISPPINLGSGAIPYQVEFDVALTVWNTTAADTMQLDDSLVLVVSTDNGATWSNVNILKTWTHGSEPSATGDHVTYLLAGYTGIVKFGYYATSTSSGEDVNVYIDNFLVREVPTCPKPDSLMSFDIGADSAIIRWFAGSNDSVWIVEYDTTGFTQGTGNIHNANNDTTILTGLMPLTTYDVYLKSICHIGDSSVWIGPITFTTTTTCPAPTLPTTFLTGTDSTLITWINGASDSSWIVEWDTTGFTVGTGNAINAANDTVSITGLTPNKTYDVYVRSICTVGDTSAWVGPLTFTTVALCPSVSAITNFGTTSDSTLITWVNGAADSTWILEYGTTGYSQGTGIIINPNNDTVAINGLMAGTTYDVYVRSVCHVGDSSMWVGPYSFSTFMGNPTLCGINLAIPDNTCSSSVKEYSLYVSSAPGTQLGTNVILKEARIIITHPYDGDLNINLVSPNGDTVELSTGNGGLGDNYGDTTGGCTQYTSFYMDAATSITTGSAPFIGSFIPEGNFNGFNNNSSPIGLWKLLICDGASGDLGNLQFAELVFDLPPTCPKVDSVMSFNVTSDSSNITWISGSNDSAWIIEWGIAGFVQGTGNIINSANDTIGIGSLTPNTTYDVYVRGICTVGDTSLLVGPISFTTPCLTIVTLPYTETFDDTSSTQSCWLVIDNNTDGDLWNMDYTSNTYNGTEVAVIKTDFNSGANDDYLISPRVTLTGNERIRFYTRAQSAAEPNDYEIWVSTTGRAPSDFTNLIIKDTIGLTTYVEKIHNLNSYTGDVYIAIKVPNGGLDGWRLYIDDFTIEEIPTCPKPTNIISYNAGTDSVIVTWTPGLNDSIWEIEYGVKGFTPGTGNFVTVTNDTAVVNGLTPDTEYDFYVRGICHVGDSSIWIGPAIDTTLPLCLKAQSFSVLGADSTSLNIGWNTDPSQVSYIVEYGLKGYTPGTGTTLTTAYPNNFLQITGLNPLTEYDFYIRSVCASGDTSVLDGPFTGKTSCPSSVGVPYLESFTTYIPECWSEAKGSLTVNTSFTDTVSSRWKEDGFTNIGTTGAASLNIYGSTITKDWIISPSINLGSGAWKTHVIEFDVALTDYNNSNAPASGFGNDDKLLLLISTDNGATWSDTNILITFDTANTPSHTGDHITYVLRNYSGIVKFAFYGESTVSNEDNDAHIDNFQIRDTVIVGINETGKLAQFKVYPNPNNGEFTLLNEGNSINTVVTILDIQGRVVYTQKQYFANHSRRRINLNNTKTGVYILQIQNNGRKEQHRIIIE